MDLKITSEKIANPLLVDLLKKLTDSFNRMNREFYVIGATARDIIIGQLTGIASGRKTRDLDIAIAIPDWSVFDEILPITRPVLKRNLKKTTEADCSIKS